VAYESNNDFPHECYTHIYKAVKPFAFNTTDITTKGDKRRRIALNCMANMFVKTSNVLEFRELSPQIFNELGKTFEFLYKRIKDCGINSQKSENFLRTLTTCLRAMNFALIDIKKLEESTSIRIFMKFYKLLFLGTPFAKRMLDLKVEDIEDEENVESTSDQGVSSSSEAEDFLSSVSTGVGGENPFSKLKQYCLLCIQQISKINGASVFNHWNYLFPSFLFIGDSDSSGLMQDFNLDEFLKKAENSIEQEPTLIYHMFTEKSPKLRVVYAITLGTLLDYSPIQKWLGPLELNPDGTPN
jgi:hypothetical protein